MENFRDLREWQVLCHALAYVLAIWQAGQASEQDTFSAVGVIAEAGRKVRHGENYLSGIAAVDQPAGSVR
jgi:hypothetical protein